MPKQNKFENVDVLLSPCDIKRRIQDFIRAILTLTGRLSQGRRQMRVKRTRPSYGLPTVRDALLRERDVFLKDTAPHNTWRFYMEQTSDRILAYAIELTDREHGKIKGNLYELDYSRHYERVKGKRGCPPIRSS